MNLANLRGCSVDGSLSLARRSPGANGFSMGIPVAQDLEKFRKAGLVKSEVDAFALAQANTPTGSRRVVSGDPLSIRPSVLDPLSSSLAEGSGGVLLRRVGDDGSTWPPLHAKMPVRGRRPSAIEDQMDHRGLSIRECRAIDRAWRCRWRREALKGLQEPRRTGYPPAGGYGEAVTAWQAK